MEYFDLAIDTAIRKQDGRLVTRVIADAAAMAEKESMYGYKNRRDVHVSEETYVQEWAQKASRYYAEAYKFAIDCNNKAIAMSYEVKHAEMAALRQD